MEDKIYHSSSFFETPEGEIDMQFLSFKDEGSSMPWLQVKTATRFGQVWRIKGVNPAYCDSDEAQLLIEREFERGATLWHPGIARVIALQDVHTMQGRCIIEEWVDGKPIAEMNVDVMENDRRIAIARQIIDAVSYYREKDIVHGNLGEGVMISPYGNVKILNFDPRATDAQTDFTALAQILEQLKLPRKFTKFIHRCRRGDYSAGRNLRDHFERIVRSRPWRWVVVIALALLALGAIALAFGLGRHQQQVDIAQLPNGYSMVASVPDGMESAFSTISQSTIYHLNLDSVTPPPEGGGAPVDMGLSVKWSKMNLGCTQPTVNYVGGYYAWGDTTDRSSWGGLDKYWPESRPMPTGSISGGDMDFARLRWGKPWRIPTRQEFEELVNRCTWKYRLAHDGAPGYVVTGPNGNSIFLPLAGESDDGINYQNIGKYGYYWTSTPGPEGRRMASYVLLDERNIITDNVEAINVMMSIRPVRE